MRTTRRELWSVRTLYCRSSESALYWSIPSGEGVGVGDGEECVICEEGGGRGERVRYRVCEGEGREVEACDICDDVEGEGCEVVGATCDDVNGGGEDDKRCEETRTESVTCEEGDEGTCEEGDEGREVKCDICRVES